MIRPAFHRGWIYGWLLLLPAAVMLGTFTHYPTVASFYRSLFLPATASRPAEFVGLENYAFMLEDPVFWQALHNNVWFALGTIPAAIALAMLMALLVNAALPGRALMRMAYFTPTILPMIAVANIWLFFYTPGIGLLDQFLKAVGLSGHNWLGDPDTVMWCMIVMMIWKEAGFFMIFYLAALQSLPPELEEAARLEGAGRWHYFRRVVFPLLMPTTLFVLINAMINAFKIVDHLFVMTKGGPNNASTLLLYYIYETAFSFFDLAYGAALTAVLLVVLIGLAIGQYRLIEKRIHYR
jgi:sn-glycerol 3-phosphate transport system permease protein